MDQKKTDIIILEARKKLKMTQKDLADKNVKYLVDINVLENGQVAKTGDNVMSYLVTGILSAIGLVKTSVIIYRKKQIN